MTTSAPTTILRTVDKPRLRVIGEPIPTPRRPPNEQLRPREFLTAQEEPAIFALSRACIARGTGSSNPSPSSGESTNIRFFSRNAADANSAGFGQGFEPCCDIDLVAVDVAPVLDDVAQIDPHAQFDAAIR